MWGPFWYIFLLMGNFFYHVRGGLFSPCGGLWLRFHPYWDLFFTMWVDNHTMWGTFCYVFLFIGNLFYHVVAFLLLFSPFGVLFCTYGERFCTYTWGLFVHMGGGLFCTYGGHFGLPPPYEYSCAPPCAHCHPTPYNYASNNQARQTRPNAGGGGCRGPSKIRQRGVAIIFYFLRVKNRTF